MKVTQEKRPSSQVGLDIEVPPERLKKVYDQVVQKFTREANFPGFRKGKVPRPVLIQRFGELRLKATALEDLLNQSIQQAIEQEKLDVLGEVSLTSSFDTLLEQCDFQQPITFSIVVDVPPTPILHQYQGFTLQAEEVKPDLTQIDRLLEERRREIATLIPVDDRPAQLEDVATISFKGQVDVAKQGDLSEEEKQSVESILQGVDDYQVDLIGDRFIPGFVDGIVGMALEETKDIALTFPDNYTQEQLAGKSVIFTVTLQDLKTRELPDLDDDFAQEISEFETLAELRASLEEQITEEATHKTNLNKEAALLAELTQHIEVELPKSMLEREIDYLIDQSELRFKEQGISIKQLLGDDKMAEYRTTLLPEATTRLKQRLALKEIAALESITADPSAVATTLAKYKDMLKDRAIDSSQLKVAIQQDLTGEKVIEWILTNSTVELVPEGSLATPKLDIPELDIQDDDMVATTTEDPTVVVDVQAVDVDTVDAETDVISVDAADTDPDSEDTN